MILLYRFSTEEVDLLMDWALTAAVRCSAVHDKKMTAESRAQLTLVCRIVGELYQPSLVKLDEQECPAPAIVDDPGKPRCVHGRFFTDPCEACANPSPAREFRLTDEERKALDEALAGRTAQLTPEFARRHDPPVKNWDDEVG
jgi:hypothetical protein